MTFFQRNTLVLGLLAVLGGHAANAFDEFDADADDEAAFSAEMEPGTTVDCGSSQYHYKTCEIGFPVRAVYLERQVSGAACVQGRSWGYSPSGFIWVDKGCRGLFRAVPWHRR